MEIVLTEKDIEETCDRFARIVKDTVEAPRILRGRDLAAQCLWGCDFAQAIALTLGPIAFLPEPTPDRLAAASASSGVAVDILWAASQGASDHENVRSFIEDVRCHGVLFVIGPDGGARRSLLLEQIDVNAAGMLNGDRLVICALHRRTIEAEYLLPPTRFRVCNMELVLANDDTPACPEIIRQRALDSLRMDFDAFGLDGADDIVAAASEIAAATPLFSIFGCRSLDTAAEILAGAGWTPGDFGKSVAFTSVPSRGSLHSGQVST